MKVLITGAGALLGQGIIRALRSSSLDVTVIAVDPDPLAAGLYWADAAYLIPWAAAPDYLERIERILAVERPDVLLVGTDVELPIFARHRERLEKTYGMHVVVSPEHVVQIAEDKWLTYQFLRELRMDYPLSCLPGDEEQLISEVGFPLIVKPRVGCRSIGVHVVHDRAELMRLIEADPTCMIQECVATPEDEYTAGAVVFDGKCHASIVMRRRLRDGNTYQAFVDEYSDLNAQVRILAEHLRAHGPVNIQFRLDGDRVKVFEINARFSGTTPLRVHAGFNEVEMILRHLIEHKSIVQPEIAPMTILRHWSETVVSSNMVLSRDRR
ncbi:MAG: ATP-grasp domain-containing protein [Bradymonadaceae bacterium]|nr:ATP-grasp domain-containing protein [Lujinxingiaceae bacterium]